MGDFKPLFGDPTMVGYFKPLLGEPTKDDFLGFCNGDAILSYKVEEIYLTCLGEEIVSLGIELLSAGPIIISLGFFLNP